MSTKIYEAYRAKPETDIWSLVRDIRMRAQAPINQCLRNLYEAIAVDVDTSTERYSKALAHAKDERLARLTVAQDIITREYKAQAGSAQRNLFHLDVSVAIRGYEGRLYLIPHYDYTMSGALAFLAEMPQLDGYAYWNNTDRDEDVSEAEWDERRRTWNAIDRIWQDVLVLQLVESMSFYMKDPGDALIRERMMEMKKAIDSASG